MHTMCNDLILKAEKMGEKWQYWIERTKIPIAQYVWAKYTTECPSSQSVSTESL